MSFRLNEPNVPGFLVQTWQKEGGMWKLVSFDIKRQSLAPPADLLARAAHPAGAKAADSKLQTTVETLLTTWLIDRRLDAASAMFLPESYSCDALEETGTHAPANDNRNVRRFLEEVVAQFPKAETLQRILSAAQMSHRDLKPLTHAHDGSYLLAEASTELMRMYACRAGTPTIAGNSLTAAAQAGGVLTAFHLSHSKQESAAVISLYWKNVNGDWRVASFTVSAD